MTNIDTRTANCSMPQRRSLQFDCRCTPEVKSKMRDLLRYERDRGALIQSEADLLEHLVLNPVPIVVTKFPERPAGLGPFKGGRTVHDHMRVSPYVMDTFRLRLEEVRKDWPSVRSRADLLERWIISAWDRVFSRGDSD